IRSAPPGPSGTDLFSCSLFVPMLRSGSQYSPNRRGCHARPAFPRIDSQPAGFRERAGARGRLGGGTRGDLDLSPAEAKKSNLQIKANFLRKNKGPTCCKANFKANLP